MGRYVSLMGLTELREAAALTLAPAGPDDPPVVESPVDSIDPPALELGWAEPWLTFQTPCYWEARLSVVCWAGRLEPGAGVEVLEGLIGYVITRVRASHAWSHETTRSPRMIEKGGIPLLGAQVIYRAAVTIGGP